MRGSFCGWRERRLADSEDERRTTENAEGHGGHGERQGGAGGFGLGPSVWWGVAGKRSVGDGCGVGNGLP